MVVGKNARAEITAKAFDFRHKKNILALKDLTSVSLRQIVESNPDVSLKDVLSDIVKDFPQNIPADVLQQMTEFVLTEWASLHVQHQKAA